MLGFLITVYGIAIVLCLFGIIKRLDRIIKELARRD